MLRLFKKRDALNLINGQKAEIERLNNTIYTFEKHFEFVKAEAVKEVMEKLKRFLSEKCGNVVEDNPNLDKILFGYRIEEVDEYIDNLVKEMVGENND